MGLFDKKWIVEFEASKGVFSSTKKQNMVVEATSKYDAERVAKSILKPNFSYIKILSISENQGNSSNRDNLYKPPVNTVKTNQDMSTKTRSTQMTAEQRKDAKLKIKLDECDNLRWKIAQKEKQIKRTPYNPIKTGIVGALCAFSAFAIGWVPHGIYKNFENASRTSLNDWVEFGHSESDSHGQELLANIQKYSEKADSVIWIPFVVLAISIVLLVVAVFVSKKKVPAQQEKAKSQLENLKKELLAIELSIGEE